ncbi:MAG: hypothetical protein ACREEA_09575, partial [Stellaceae bacterium]
RVEVPKSVLVHWSRENWRTSHDTETTPTTFGTYVADLDTADLVAGEEIAFTLYWQDERRWEGQDYRLKVA